MKKITFLLILFLPATLLNQNAISAEWPVLKKYDQEHSYKIALPIGGIGTGTISLGGRGNLQDVEIMNTPAKGYNPGSGRENSTFFTLYTEVEGKKKIFAFLKARFRFTFLRGVRGLSPQITECPVLKNPPLRQLIPLGRST